MFELFKKKFPADGIKESTDLTTISVGRDILPWLEQSTIALNIAHVTYSSGKSILMASAIEGSFQELANQARSYGSGVDNNFYSLAYAIAHFEFRSLPKLQKPKGEFPIYYSKSGKLRVYALVVPAGKVAQLIPNVPALDMVIRIAIVDKNHESDVLKKIATM